MKLNYIFIFSVMIFVLTACSSTKPTRETTLESTVTLTWQSVNEPGSGGFITAAAISPFSAQRMLLGGDMLGVGLSTDGGSSWKSTTGFSSFEMAEFTFHPTDANTVMVGSMSGPFISHDGGATWQAQRKGMGAMQDYSCSRPIQKILYVKGNASQLLGFEGSKRDWSSNVESWGKVWKWSSVNGVTQWRNISQIGSGGKPGIISATYGGGTSTTLYAVADSKPWRSVDGGVKWQAITNGLPSAVKATWVSAHPSKASELYLSTDSTDTGSSRSAGNIYVT